ncbi:phosphate ABC transporter substrate-binding protein, PhoT family (TC 3.A.1.7.1) [Planifilum fulgidum]|jgi:phosphate transport system substrate-binding protein|uniref:Phosphate-binding protein n=1 Tax=Planifilum fulgidum TaxID=201973 RepID=A0A1I2PLG5_9BACL|nr:PstS family phosphate ABC transporter substrate-binding protein [Planifilum fulgidum]MBO2497760.1 phosphate ABC transporter substrate-binding protein [Bacillota bacterium]MBO2533084.1 phosphate ABC transporter substrate-binding protein [Thermoactinomycetaceae bacterium]SFG16263.1 phosphate ABC transporter substrate-binding protein, PhoT family (TC 3.A.1.7.1) [Planifilum fulgidum]
MFKRGVALFCSVVLAVGLLAGCGQSGRSEGDGEGLSGTVKIDGSSTVFPISQAVAEEFMAENPKVQVTVSESGTGGGFQKWVAGETDINDASRPIKDEEKKKAAENGIEPIEIPVAYDGITVVVNKDNDFVEELTVDELKKIWEPDSKVKRWSDVRPEWPKEPIKLYGPGTASGTFGYFTEAIVGEEGKSRTDYTASEDDNVLVQGVSGDKYALGYFGYAYYAENKDRLKAVKIDGGDGPVEPTEQTINDGTYSPLSRPVFIYVSSKAMERPEVKEFVKFYIEVAKDLAKEVGYIPLPDADYEESMKRLEGK